MTSSPDVVPSHTSTSLPTIYTANGSPMHVSHLGNVSTPALSVSNVYQIPKLTHNLLSASGYTHTSVCFSQDHLADIFTKPLPLRTFRALTSKLIMVSLQPP